jgi:aromatic-L-amino-acid decarboxylase
MLNKQENTTRYNSLEIGKEAFREMGHELIDLLAEFYESIGERAVTKGENPAAIDTILGHAPLPEEPCDARAVIAKTTALVLEHSLLNGHPKFMGFITSSPTKIGLLAEMLATAVNPNMGANILSPMATAIEKQTIRWLAEFIGVSPDCGGHLVSGGNMANFTAFLAARTAKADKKLKTEGLHGIEERLVFYCSTTTHTWIEKAAVLFGHGMNAIRWIHPGQDNTMDTSLLRKTIQEDLSNGYKPFLVVGNAGDVSTGVVDNLAEIAGICKEYDLWFHVDGAYGIPAAAVPEYRSLFNGIEFADSLALDPHKWLYAPLEAGVVLVKNPQHLLDTYSAHPDYYNFEASKEGSTLNYYEYGFQNSKGFKALKVWMALQQAGRSGYVQMIRDDIALAGYLHEKASAHPELEAHTHHLSITTFRYRPAGEHSDQYLNKLNENVVNAIQEGGEAFLSDAVINGNYFLRACIVNFRTTKHDLDELIDIVVREGRKHTA